jgi:hypothetical protein
MQIVKENMKNKVLATMLETSPVVSAEIQLKQMLDFAKFN